MTNDCYYEKFYIQRKNIDPYIWLASANNYVYSQNTANIITRNIRTKTECQLDFTLSFEHILCPIFQSMLLQQTPIPQDNEAWHKIKLPDGIKRIYFANMKTIVGIDYV